MILAVSVYRHTCMHAHTHKPETGSRAISHVYDVQIHPHLPTFSGVYIHMWIYTKSQAHSQINAGTAEYDPKYVPRR